MTTNIHQIIPKLELHLLRDDELNEYTQDKINKINAANAGQELMLYENAEEMVYE